MTLCVSLCVSHIRVTRPSQSRHTAILRPHLCHAHKVMSHIRLCHTHKVMSHIYVCHTHTVMSRGSCHTHTVMSRGSTEIRRAFVQQDSKMVCQSYMHITHTKLIQNCIKTHIHIYIYKFMHTHIHTYTHTR